MIRTLQPACFAMLILFAIVTAAAAVEQQKSFGGVGLQVVPTVNGDLVVLRVVEGSPSAEQGMMPGDLIYKVDDFTLKGSEFGKVVSEHLWGAEGSRVTLHFQRPGVSGRQSATLTRSSMDPRLTVSPAVQGTNVEPAVKR
jgi:carboxyl-terminal processing protease